MRHACWFLQPLFPPLTPHFRMEIRNLLKGRCRAINTSNKTTRLDWNMINYDESPWLPAVFINLYERCSPIHMYIHIYIYIFSLRETIQTKLHKTDNSFPINFSCNANWSSKFTWFSRVQFESIVKRFHPPFEFRKPFITVSSSLRIPGKKYCITVFAEVEYIFFKIESNDFDNFFFRNTKKRTKMRWKINGL